MTELRTKVIKIRTTDVEYAELVKRSSKPRLAEWMRELCLGVKAPRANLVPSVNPQLLRQLAGIGNNLNQIARAINSQEWKPVDRIQVISALIGIERNLVALKAERIQDDS